MQRKAGECFQRRRNVLAPKNNHYTSSIKAYTIRIKGFEAEIPGSNFAVPQHSLYNGNISAMVTTITQPDTATSGYAVQTPQPLGNAYRYDQLNRLVESQAYTTLDLDGNKWLASASSVRGGSGLAPYDGLYNNKFIYDGNGNILHQDRRDNNGLIFDSMSYQYNRDVNGKLVQNRLYHVNDAVGSGAATDDIDDEGTFTASASTINTANNYGYDGIGNMTRDASEGIDSIKWTVYGKIKEIKRSSGSTKKNLKFGYDANSKRVVKSSYTSAGVWIESTYYVRDAQGNVMGTYHENASDSSLSYKWLEADLYGPSRIGLTYPDKEMVGADTVNEVVHDTLNKRQYELSNHLGNVLTVAYDHSIAVDSNADNIVDYHLADLASVSDYSAFGAPLSGRGFSSEKYRYGFNGKEKDDEVKGSGDQYDYGMRIYDARLGRFLSVDPLSIKFPYWSPYHFAGNTPIQALDMDGKEILDYRTFYRLATKKIENIRSYDIQISLYDPETVTRVEMNDNYAAVDKAIYTYDQSASIDLQPKRIYTISEGFTGSSAAAFGVTNPNSGSQSVVYDEQRQNALNATIDGTPDTPVNSATSKENSATVNHMERRISNGDALGGVATDAFNWTMSQLFPNHLQDQENAYQDLKIMETAYRTALTVISTYDFSIEDEAVRAQVITDLASYVVDLKLPVNGTQDYFDYIQHTGAMMINENKELQTKTPLITNSNDDK